MSNNEEKCFVLVFAAIMVVIFIFTSVFVNYAENKQEKIIEQNAAIMRNNAKYVENINGTEYFVMDDTKYEIINLNLDSSEQVETHRDGTVVGIAGGAGGKVGPAIVGGGVGAASYSEDETTKSTNIYDSQITIKYANGSIGYVNPMDVKINFLVRDDISQSYMVKAKYFWMQTILSETDGYRDSYIVYLTESDYETYHDMVERSINPHTQKMYE